MHSSSSYLLPQPSPSSPHLPTPPPPSASRQNPPGQHHKTMNSKGDFKVFISQTILVSPPSPLCSPPEPPRAAPQDNEAAAGHRLHVCLPGSRGRQDGGVHRLGERDHGALRQHHGHPGHSVSEGWECSSTSGAKWC